MAERTLDAHPTGVPDAESLTEKQRATLRTIREHPEATQAELADRLGVSSATINTRVNAIDGFDWSRRRAFVDRVFDDAADDSAGPDGATAANGDTGANAVTEANTVNERNEADATNERNEPNDPDGTDGPTDSGDADERTERDTARQQDGLDEADERQGTNGPNDSDGAREGEAADGPDRPDRLAREDQPGPIGVGTDSGATCDRQSTEALADRIDELTGVVESVACRVDDPDPSTTGAFEDPELVHKILRACLNDDDITPDEELEIVRAVVR